MADPNGGVIAGATVTAKNDNTGTVTTPVTSSSEGVYEIASLPPGSYTVTVEAAGFKLAEEANFLRNPNDPRDKNTPDPPMPKDEFFLKFTKP